MKNKLLKLVRSVGVIGSFCLPMTGQAQVKSYSLNSDQVEWKVLPETIIKSGKEAFLMTSADEKWVTATVPGTVFGSYVEQGLESDPNFADNIYKVDKKKYDRNFWYKTSFRLPSDLKGIIWLNMEGVNRKAEIYLNGERLGLLDGFMQRGKFNVSSALSKTGNNMLAVLVHCPQTPIANYASPTYISSSSWDWMPYVPGLLSGITDHVYLTSSAEVTIEDPWIRTVVATKELAELAVSTDLSNHSDQKVTGYLKGLLLPGRIEFSKKVELNPNQSKTILFDKKEFAQLALLQPKLWWPNGYGDPNLYSCQLTFENEAGISDFKKVDFGIRKITYDTLGSVLHIKVNGTPIFIKGGNWGMSEYLLRCRGKEYDTKLRLHKEMNYNMIRNWIGSTTDEEFYQACDRNGMLVWDDFWLNSHPNLPDDVHAFNRNAVEKIKRYRNYACIAVWCGDNEGYPLPPLNEWLREDVRVYDGNDRLYQPNSHSDALTGSGVWTNLEPKSYFASAPLGFGGNKGWGFRTEMGTAVFVNFDSFKEFMPQDSWWPRNEMWDKHFFGPSAANASPDVYTKAISDSYGEATGIEDYCRKAQLLNIETNKALYEGWVDHMWNDASGILVWMSQSAYPSMVWQTYDYYYDLNGAYWGVKKGCEPVHILWNSADNSIKVTNTSGADVKNLVAQAKVYTKNGAEVKDMSRLKKLDALQNTANYCFNLNFEAEKNLAYQKPTFASSFTKEAGEPSSATDGSKGSRWSSQYTDNEWLCVDLGGVVEFNTVDLFWEAAYAKTYKVQVSNDSTQWTDVYHTSEGKGGREQLAIEPVKARFVRMLGLQKASQWGFSLWEMKVFNLDKSAKVENKLSDVHFIKLSLNDEKGQLISDNFYWRGNNDLDYKGLQTLPEVKLKVKSKAVINQGNCLIETTIENPTSSPAIAFAVHLQLVDEKTGKRILPVFTTDNYFSLLKGESKKVRMEFDAALLKNGLPKLEIWPYANKQKQVVTIELLKK